jgi:hypothetical protein
MIRMACPACQGELYAPDGYAGTQGAGIKYDQRLLVPPERGRTILATPVPAADDTVPADCGPAHEAQSQSAEVTAAGQVPEGSSTVTVVCPHCGRAIPVTLHDLDSGQMLECARCDIRFRAINVQ